MTYRIVVNVVAHFFEFVLSFNQVLPEPLLPYAAVSSALLWCGHVNFITAVGKPTLSEIRLDVLPAARVVCIVTRQRPNAVQVVPQEHDC